MSNEMTKVEKAILLGVKEMNRKMKDHRQIDWEQRRYEVARDWLCATVASGLRCSQIDERCKLAVRAADALIAELKKGGEI